MRNIAIICLTLSALIFWNCAGKAVHKPDRSDPPGVQATGDKPASSEQDVTSNSSGEARAEIEAPVTVDGPFTLEAAIAYAVTHNLEAAEKKLESDIQKEAIVGARLKMLPSLTIEGTLSQRDDYDASYSDPLFEDGSGAQDFNYSRDKSSQQISSELSWNLLNFGIAYYQKQQTAVQYQVLEQRRRRVIQNLKLDVAKSFWNVAVAKRSMTLAEGAVKRLIQREQILQRQLESRTASELEALEASVVLSEMQMALSGLENKYRGHKCRLAELMGLPADSDFEIAEVDFDPDFKNMGIDIDLLETEALAQRPELFERELEERITQDEARIALFRALPKPTLYYRYAYDGDSHLYHNQWQEAGLRLSFDLLSVPVQRSQRRELAIKKTMNQTRQQSMAAAVITQLRLAVIDFEDAMERYQLSKTVAAKRELLMEARRRHAASGSGTYEDVIRDEAKYLITQLRQLSALAELMVAEQRILNSTGSDDIGEPVFLIDKKIAGGASAASPYKLSQAKDGMDYHGVGEALPYSLMLSSWYSWDQALSVLPHYVKKGLAAYIVKAEVSEAGSRYRIFEGYYRTRQEAKDAKVVNKLPKAIVMKTPFAIHVGNFPTKKAMTVMMEKLLAMGYSSYTVLGMDSGFQMLTGAFSTENLAEAQVEAMQQQGFKADIVRR